MSLCSGEGVLFDLGAEARKNHGAGIVFLLHLGRL